MMDGIDEFHAREGTIRLGQLLKAAGLVESGGEAKAVLADGLVTVNGEVETRRGRQLAPGRRRRARRRVRAPDLRPSRP